MSLPKVPNIDPKINVSKRKALNLLLTSIALEDIGLSHVINAEGEKLQAAIKKFEECDDPCCSMALHNLLMANRSVDRTLRSVIKNQLLLQFTLEDVVELYQTEGFEDDDK